MRRVISAFSVVVLALFALPVVAQQNKTSPVLVASGRVTKPAPDGPIGVPNVWVTLHRVGRDSAGPIDSMRTDANGAYRLQYRPFGESNAVYFTASLYHGIAYFSMPLGGGPVRETASKPLNTESALSQENSDADTDPNNDGDIVVFDTSSSKLVPLTVRGRHLIVAAPDDDGMRKITEVFEISNDSFVTKIAVGDEAAGASWSAQLPANATTPQLLEGDLPAAAVRFEGGRILVFSPFAPGLKQVAYTYALPQHAFPFSLPIEQPVSVFEVLSEESNARVSGARLQQVPPVTLEGRNFRRYLASDASANSVVSVEVVESERPIDPRFVALLTLVVGGSMVGTLVWAMRRRR